MRAYGPGDVLDPLITHILEPEVRFVSNLLVACGCV
jgi:hypothetical protein